MSVQIIITGDHATDALAQLKTISEALEQKIEVSVPQIGIPNLPKVNAFDKGSEEETVISKVEVEEGKVASVKKFTGKEHKEEADKMIAAGAINNDVFPLISKFQQRRVEEALNAIDEKEQKEYMIQNGYVEPEAPVESVGPMKSAEEMKENIAVNEVLENPKEEPTEDLGGLFDEPEAEPKKEITENDFRELISKVCKDENGKDLPEMYAAVRAEIKNAVDEGKEPKIMNVSADKLEAVYNSIKSLKV